MARSNERYVRFYTFGSAAAKVEERRAVLPKEHAPKKREPIPVDPVAFVGNVVAIVLAILMVIGLVQVAHVAGEVRDMQAQIQSLEMEQEVLQKKYEAGYDLDEVRVAAESMGMIPAEEAVRVRVEVPSADEIQVQRVSWWESLLVSLRQIFA